MTIKELREKEKLSQAKLAKALGVSPSLIGAIETGKKNVSDKLADKVKEVYNVTLVGSEPAEIAANAAVTQSMEEAVKQAVEAHEKVEASVEKTADAVETAVKKAAPKAKKAVKDTAKAAKATVKKTAAKAKSGAKQAHAQVVEKKTDVPAPVFIQSPLGGEITSAEILTKVGTDVDRVYVRVDQNKAYWVKGEETGSVDLW